MNLIPISISISQLSEYSVSGGQDNRSKDGESRLLWDERNLFSGFFGITPMNYIVYAYFQ